MKRLFALCLALFPLAPVPAPAQDAGPTGKAVLNPLSAFDPSKLEGFLGRPLFSPTRRPPPPAVLDTSSPAEAPAPTQQPPPIRLVGIIRTPKESIAQLVEGDDAHRVSVRVGDFLGDWMVSSIDASTLVLKQGEQQARFEVFKGKAADAEAGTSPLDQFEGTPNAKHARRRTFTQEDKEAFFGK